MKKATHRDFTDTIVTYKMSKDFMGYEEVKVRFSNGETTTMSPKRFDELFEKKEGIIK